MIANANAYWHVTIMLADIKTLSHEPLPKLIWLPTIQSWYVNNGLLGMKLAGGMHVAMSLIPACLQKACTYIHWCQ